MRYTKEPDDEDFDEIPMALRIKIRQLIAELEKASKKLNSGGETNEKQK